MYTDPPIYIGVVLPYLCHVDEGVRTQAAACVQLLAFADPRLSKNPSSSKTPNSLGQSLNQEELSSEARSTGGPGCGSEHPVDPDCARRFPVFCLFVCLCVCLYFGFYDAYVSQTHSQGPPNAITRA